MKKIIKKVFQPKLVQNEFKDSTNISEENISSYFINSSYWSYRTNIKIDNQKEKLYIDSLNKKPKYLSFLENNFNFNLPPESNTNISPEGPFTIKITGKVSGKIRVLFYLIEYHSDQRINTQRIKINQNYNLRFHPEATSFRIVLRIEGKGSLTLTGMNFKIRKLSESIKLTIDSKRSIKDIKVACILDEFSTKSFSDVFKLIEITPHEWKEMLLREKPDFLFVESAWKGIEGKWQYQIGKYNNNFNNYLLKQVIKWFNDNNIPTVFWNKEDPIHFEKFVDTAKLFDYIFTTDSRMIPKYKETTNNENVYALPFAANPIFHNPIHNLKPRKKSISFAGSYYANRHENRKRDMEELLDLAKGFSLDIYDRNYKDGEPINENFRYPDRFVGNIKGSLPYSQIDRAYKDYRLMLNVNSVKNSPTMFSRRVFEGLACGTPIVSSYSRGIKKMFGETVIMPKSESMENLRSIIDSLLNDDSLYRRQSLEGIRKVLNNHTYAHRAKNILNLLSIPYDSSKSGLTVVFKLKTIEEFNKAIEIFNQQSLEYKRAMFIIDTFDGFEELLNKYNNAEMTTILIDYAERYDIRNLFVTDYFTILDINLFYGKHYLEDLYHATLYSKADIVGKNTTKFDTYDIEEKEYEYVHEIINETATFKVSSLEGFSIGEVINNKEIVIDELLKYKGAKLFSSDKFNFSFNRGELTEI